MAAPKDVRRIASLLATEDDWEKRREGLTKLRELATSHESAQWVAEHVAPLVPYLVDMLKELRSALLLDCCSTISQLVWQLNEEPHFLRELPKLFVEIMNLPSSNGVIFAAGNQALQVFIDATTNSRLMGVIEEACANRHNHRQRARGIDCALRMLLQWPVPKLRRHEHALEGVLRSGCKDANAHVRASARRGAAAMVLLLPKAGRRLLDEVEPGTADLVMAETGWVEDQRQNCSHGIGDGAAPVHTEELISAPQLPEGFDPKRVDFRPPGGGPTEDEDRAVRKETSAVTSFQMRQLVKGLPIHVRNILAQASTRLKTEFRKFDLNGDGVVDPDEMRTGLHGMNLGLSVADVEAIINIVNVYGDGVIDYAEFAMLFGKRDIPIPGKDGGVISTNAARPYEFTQVDKPVLQNYHGPEWLSVDEEHKIKGGGRPEDVIRHGGHRETLFGDGKTTLRRKQRPGPNAPKKSQNRVRGTDGAGSLAISSRDVGPAPAPALLPSSGRRAVAQNETEAATNSDTSTAGDSRLSLLQSVGRSTQHASTSPERASGGETLADPPTPKMPMPQMPRYQVMPNSQQVAYPYPPHYGQSIGYTQQNFEQVRHHPPQLLQHVPQGQPVQHLQVHQYVPQQGTLHNYGQQPGPGPQHHYHNHHQVGAVQQYQQQQQQQQQQQPLSGQYALPSRQQLPGAPMVAQPPVAIGHGHPLPPAPGSAYVGPSGSFNDTFHSQMSELSGQEQRLQSELKQMNAADSKRKAKTKRGAAKGVQHQHQHQHPQQGSARFGRRAAAPPAA